MNQTIKELYNRKSVRVYKKQEIEPEKKEAIIQAAIQAPTAGNMTLYTIIDIQDQAIKDALALSCDNQPFIKTAPMILIFVADYQKWYDSFCINHENVRKPQAGDMILSIEDACIAAQNAVVAAESMGIGSCYIGDIIENHDLHRELLNLPKYTVPVAMLCFGYPETSQINRKKPARFDKDDIVSVDRYRHFGQDDLMNMFEKRGYGKSALNSIENVYNRKWTQPFTQEMTASIRLYLKQFSDD